MRHSISLNRIVFLNLWFLTVSCGITDEQLQPTPPTNVIIITWDTVGKDMVTAETAPFFTELGGNGLVFSNNRTTAPVTLPAHASLMSGLYPHHHGARYNGSRDLNENVETIASILQSQGWITGAFVSASVLNQDFKLDRGFEIYSNVGSNGYNEESVATRSGNETVSEALGWVAGQDINQPMFLWVHMFEAHRPWTPSASSSEIFESPYLASVRDLDTLTNQLLTSLSTQGRLENAVVVITSDHGEGLGRGGEWTHGYYTNNATMMTPLLFAGYGESGLPSDIGPATNQNSSIVDIAPTLFEILQIESDTQFDGVDLLGDRVEDRIVLMESLSPALSYGATPIFSITDGERVWNDEQPDLRLWPIQTAEISLQERQQLEGLGYLGASTNGSEPEVDPLPQDRAELMTLYQSEAAGVIPIDAVSTLRSMENRWGNLPPISSLMVRLLDIQGLREEADAHTISLPGNELLISERNAEFERLSRIKEHIEAALSYNPEHESAHYDLGVVLWQLGEIEQAEANLRESVEKELRRTTPTRSSSIPTFSNFYLATNRPRLALETLELLPPELRDDCDYGRLLLIEDRKVEALNLLIRCASTNGVLSNREVEFLRGSGDIGL